MASLVVTGELGSLEDVVKQLMQRNLIQPATIEVRLAVPRGTLQPRPPHEHSGH